MNSLRTVLSHRNKFQLWEILRPKASLPTRTSSMTPKAAVWETLPHSPGHHRCEIQEEEHTQPQRTVLSLHFPFSCSHSLWSSPHRNIRKSFTPFIPDHWLGLPLKHRGAGEDFRPPSPPTYINPDKWLELRFGDCILKYIEGVTRKTFIKKNTLKELQRIFYSWTWFSIVSKLPGEPEFSLLGKWTALDAEVGILKS